MEALYQEILDVADIINNNTLRDIDLIKRLCNIYNTYEIEFNTDLGLAKLFLELAESLQFVKKVGGCSKEWFHIVQLNLLVKKLKKNISIRDLPRWRLQEMDRAGFSSLKPIAL
jgi:preprotein translocase subunit Sec63